MLGNKCAGQRDLKTVYFKETIISGHFLAWSLAICVFLCSALFTTGRQRRAMVGATHYKLFLNMPWVNKQLASSDFTLRRRYQHAFKPKNHYESC
jgi:hypothetical protein